MSGFGEGEFGGGLFGIGGLGSLEDAIAAFVAGTAVITRRAEVWLSDLSAKLYQADLPIVDGTITVSYARDERRMIDLTINNSDRAITHAVGQFWYDKVIKTFRGVVLSDGRLWEVQTGEFLMDKIEETRFPANIVISGRDYTKKLLISKFAADTTFALGSSFDDVFSAIAINAGINPLKILAPATGLTLNTDYTIARNTTRQQALKTMCDSLGYEFFFDAAGFLVRRPFQDPATAPAVWTFKTGPQAFTVLPGGGGLAAIGYPGHMVDFTKISGDTDLVNHWVVSGASTNTGLVWAEAINNNPASPTCVQRIGDRFNNEDNPLLTTVAQCQARANNLLAVSALEDWEVDAETLVLPWLDAGVVVGFEDPDPTPNEPSIFLLTDFDLPMKLGTMKPIMKRVALVQ